MYRHLLVVATLLSSTSLALAAPPSLTAPTPGTELPRSAAQAKSPTKAFEYSLAGTLIPLGLFALGAAAEGNNGVDNDLSTSLMLTGIAGIMIGPSAGHFYAEGGLVKTPGLAMRAGGASAFVLGGIIYVGEAIGGSSSCILANDPACESPPPGNLGPALIFGGLALVTVGTIYDIATAGDSARRANRSHSRLRIAPVLAKRDNGFHGIAVSGTF